jgi:hypothetical protein
MIIKFFNQCNQVWQLIDKVTDLVYQREFKRISWAMKLYPSNKEFVSDTVKIFYTYFYNPKIEDMERPETTLFQLDENNKDTEFVLAEMRADIDKGKDGYYYWPDYISYCTSPQVCYNKDMCKPLLEINFKEDGIKKLLLTDCIFPVYICNDKGDTIDKVGLK